MSNVGEIVALGVANTLLGIAESEAQFLTLQKSAFCHMLAKAYQQGLDKGGDLEFCRVRRLLEDSSLPMKSKQEIVKILRRREESSMARTEKGL